MANPVLYVLNSLDYGGTERQLTLTLRALDRDAYDPSVVALFGGGPHEADVRALDIPTTVLGLPKRAFASAIRAVASIARDRRAAIIHSALFESNVVSRVAARRTGAVPVTHLVNELDPPLRRGEPERRTWLKARIVEELDRATARWSRSKFVAVAEVVADSAARFYRVSRASIPVVRRGFDSASLEASADRPLRDSPWSDWADPRILAVGKLYPQKGYRYLARALPRLVERFPKAQVAIVGEGPLRVELATIARRAGVEESLRLLGTRPDVPPLLRHADAFVFPSLWEGAAGALVEAVMLGCPVVASDIPAHREIVDGAGATFVAPKDPAALADGLASALSDAEGIRTRASRAAVRAAVAHDIVENTRALEACYERFQRWPVRLRGS